ncbi:hypothetical protein SUGI_0735040 [Cryptomeria japonica]|nr:hypothetical protein SUGI_0735040 [Cryptomeria japonica]
MTKEGDLLREFLNVYEAKYHRIFKSLAAMDSRGMKLTVRYNAWKYKNESEALAGMAVEITKGMEEIMTDAQWFQKYPEKAETWSSIYSGVNMPSLIPSANLRIIVFIDDLDRCQEAIVLQVLSAINLVFAVCEISVILGMDKELIQRAIMKRYGDKSLKNSKFADKYLQKIIQLPLDLPDPSQVQSKDFLDRHLGVFQKQSKEGHSESEIDTEDDSMPEIDRAYNALFSAFEQSEKYYVPDFLKKLLGSVAPISGEGSSSAETVDDPPQTQPAGRIAIDIQDTDGTSNQQHISESNIRRELIPIRELLFVRYSEGERDAFCHFQAMTTEFRKLPREWKRLLTYHRLENINTLLQGWKDIDLLKTYKLEPESESESKLKSKSESKSGPGGPSLRAIINHCIKKWEGDVKENNATDSKNREVAGQENLISVVKENNGKLDKALKEVVNSQQVGKSENKDPPTQNLEEATKSQNIEVPESSNKEQLKLKEGVNDQTTSVRDATKAGDCSESSEMAGPENLMTATDKLDKALKELDSLKKEMEELKELVNSQQAGKTEKMGGEKKLKLQSWRRLKSALGKYDVSMDGIQAFQRFRFYCEAGHIQWPLNPNEDLKFPHVKKMLKDTVPFNTIA